MGEEFTEACRAPPVKHVYVDILCDHMLPAAHHLVGHEFVFQHDNAPPHTALVTTEVLAQHPNLFGKWGQLAVRGDDLAGPESRPEPD